MAQVERYVSGPQTIQTFPVDSTTVIEKGDFVVIAVSGDNSADTTLTVGYAITPSYMADAGTNTQNRETIGDQFAGIALGASASGETDPISVDIGGSAIYELELKVTTGAAQVPGTLMEVYSSATVGEDDTIVAGTASEIASLAEYVSDTTQVKIKCIMLPSKLFGTPQG